MTEATNKFWDAAKQLLCKHTEYVFIRQKFVKNAKTNKFELAEIEGCKDCGKERVVEII